MKKLHRKYCYLTTFLSLILMMPAFSQVPDFSRVPNLHKGDSLLITQLIQKGERITFGNVTAWFPKDSLSKTQMHEIASMINTGINAAEKFINAPLPWQLHSPDDDYVFYFQDGRFISHASGAGFVSIPFWRIKEGKSPWLHEALHEMLNSKTKNWFDVDVTDEYQDKNMPLWLFEGLPEYISLQVSLNGKLPRFDVFSNSSLTNIDSLFVQDINSERGKYILSFVGKKGLMPELFTNDRMLYAPGFYHGSFSFVKYLADRYGLKTLLDAISSFDKEHETIESSTRKPLETLRQEWLRSLKIEN